MFGKIAAFGNQIADALLFAAIGAIIGFGQSKYQKEREVGVVIGRSICVSGLAMAGGIVLIWFPSLSLVGQIGVASLFASLGTSGLERVFTRIVESKGGQG